SSLSELLNQALKRAGSRRALADAMDLSRQRLSRILRGEGYPPSAESLLRLARAQDLDPAGLLRAAGHDGLVELLADTYGAPDERLTATDRRWRRLREQLPADDAAMVEGLLVRLARDARKAGRKP